VWPNNLYIVLKVVTLALAALYRRLLWVHRQAFAHLADAEYLDEHGINVGLARNVATFAQGTATVTGDAGTAIPNQSLLKRGDGLQYKVIGTVVIVATQASMTVRAGDTGHKYNTDGFAPLELVTPITGVTSIEVDDAGITGGLDDENDESYRARILHKKQNPPHGGSQSEYEDWSMDKPGVTRVFVKRATPSAGSVTVLFMMDESYPSGIPPNSQANALQAYLQTVAPAADNIIVKAPIADSVAVTIDNLIPDTVAVREAVQNELKAMFKRRARPGVSGTPFIFPVAWIEEAISIAKGEQSHTLTAPAADVSSTTDHIAILGPVTFT
jgi:uncharacterized phage protein gp47/JayE